jgi:hypothetical protein
MFLDTITTHTRTTILPTPVLGEITKEQVFESRLAQLQTDATKEKLGDSLFGMLQSFGYEGSWEIFWPCLAALELDLVAFGLDLNAVFGNEARSHHTKEEWAFFLATLFAEYGWYLETVRQGCFAGDPVSVELANGLKMVQHRQTLLTILKKDIFGGFSVMKNLTLAAGCALRGDYKNLGLRLGNIIKVVSAHAAEIEAESVSDLSLI